MTTLTDTLNDFFADWTLEDAERALEADKKDLADADAALARIDSNNNDMEAWKTLCRVKVARYDHYAQGDGLPNRYEYIPAAHDELRRRANQTPEQLMHEMNDALDR